MLLLLGYAGFSIYKRYVPVSHPFTGKCDKETLLDVRVYQDIFNDPVLGAIEIPYGYLKRCHREIPDKELIIVAGDVIEKNLACRFLKKKGYRIKGYMIKSEKEFRSMTSEGLCKCMQ
ncbi:hypothetical protein BIV59_06300 [Bacillus sp. MUM 13]|nr:hypothetical protein BIV59_06300 [Bacillus sp. MUM 13]